MKTCSEIISRCMVVFICFLLVSALAGCENNAGTANTTKVLARVEVPGYLQDIKLPVHAALVDGNDVYYVLVVATRSELADSGASYTVIDEYQADTDYLLADSENSDDYPEAARAVPILYNDGRWIIVRDEGAADETLASIGFDLKQMSDVPVTLTPSAGMTATLSSRPAVRNAAVTPMAAIPSVSEMLNAITQADVEAYLSALTGVTPITVDSEAYTITTRHTDSGIPLANTVQYVTGQLQQMSGMKVSTPAWTATGHRGVNIVAELTGKGRPDEIIIMVAHLDSVNDQASEVSEPAPGADDDASGCAALLAAAGAMSGKSFQRTIRFIFTTGEEQGTLGSQAYVKSIADENIVAVLNLDMIAYSTQATPVQNIKIRNPKDLNGNRVDLAMASLYRNSVSMYGLSDSLNVVIRPDGEVSGDQSSFWDNGWPAIWVIEDDYDNYNKGNYHSVRDKLAILNLEYCTAVIKASIATVAHLAQPVTERAVFSGDNDRLDRMPIFIGLAGLAFQLRQRRRS